MTPVAEEPTDVPGQIDKKELKECFFQDGKFVVHKSV